MAGIDPSPGDDAGAAFDADSNSDQANGFNFDTGTGTGSGTSTTTSTYGMAETIVPLLLPSSTASGSWPLGIVGGWYAYGDGYGSNGLPPGLCEMAGYVPSQCSAITFPMPIATDAGVINDFPLGGPDGGDPGAICLSGTAAQVMVGPQSASIYGIGIGFDLDNAAGNATAYDAPAHGVVGFTFTVTGVPMVEGLGDVFAQFPTTETEQDPHYVAVTGDGTYTVLFSEFNVPEACACGACPNDPPFDPAKLLSVRFLVTAHPYTTVPVSAMCVTAFSAIVKN